MIYTDLENLKLLYFEKSAMPFIINHTIIGKSSILPKLHKNVC